MDRAALDIYITFQLVRADNLERHQLQRIPSELVAVLEEVRTALVLGFAAFGWLPGC